MIAEVVLWLLSLSLGWQFTEATWYAKGLPRPDSLTCASRDFPRGARLLVLSLDSRRWAEVKVTDFGPDPADPLVVERGRGLDLSRGAARRLGILRRGFGAVLVIQITPGRGWQKKALNKSEGMVR